MAVLVGVTHADAFAIVELHLPRALDVQEENVDGVVDPGDLAAGERCVPLVDVAARVVRHDAIALEAAAQALALQVRIDRCEVDGEQVLRHAIDRVPVPVAARAASAQQGLVVTRDHSRGRVVGIHHRPRSEVELEERGDVGLGGVGPERFGASAHALPRILLREHRAALEERIERRPQCLASPVGEIGPRRGVEVSARFDRRWRAAWALSPRAPRDKQAFPQADMRAVPPSPAAAAPWRSRRAVPRRCTPPRNCS